MQNTSNGVLCSLPQQHTSREGNSHGERRLYAHAERRSAVLFKVFSEISEIGLVLSTTCNSATNKPVLKTEKLCTVSLLNHPALISAVWQPAIDLPTQDTTPMKNEKYQEIKRYSKYFCSLVTSSTVNFLTLAHSYMAKEDYKQS